MSTLLCPLFNHNTHKQANRCSLHEIQYSLCSGKSQTAPQVHFYNTKPESYPQDSLTQLNILPSHLSLWHLQSLEGRGGISSLIRILSSVFPYEAWGGGVSGFINRSRKYYWPGPSAAVVVCALLPPHSSAVLPGHITGHCGTAWSLQHTVSSLTMHLAWAFFSPQLHSNTHTHTPAVGVVQACSALLVYSSSMLAAFGGNPPFTVI